MKALEKRVRLSLDVSEGFRQKVLELMIETDSVSMTEVMKKATNLLRFALEEQKAGRHLIARDDQGFETRVVVL